MALLALCSLPSTAAMSYGGIFIFCLLVLALAGVVVGLLALAVLHGAVSLVASCIGRRQRRRREAAAKRAGDMVDAPPLHAVDPRDYKARMNGNGRKLLDADTPSTSPSPSPTSSPSSSPAPTPAKRRVRSVDVVRG